eukprot:scaffold21538_cov41-Cyclotella_meneghiniana.AAC.3
MAATEGATATRHPPTSIPNTPSIYKRQHMVPSVELYLDTNNNTNNNSTPVFLLLVDDNRGSSGVCRSFSHTKTWDVYKIDAVFRG